MSEVKKGRGRPPKVEEKQNVETPDSQGESQGAPRAGDIYEQYAIVPPLKEGIEVKRSVPVHPEAKGKILQLSSWFKLEGQKIRGSGSSRMRFIARQLEILARRV